MPYVAINKNLFLRSVLARIGGLYKTHIAVSGGRPQQEDVTCQRMGEMIKLLREGNVEDCLTQCYRVCGR